MLHHTIKEVKDKFLLSVWEYNDNTILYKYNLLYSTEDEALSTLNLFLRLNK